MLNMHQNCFRPRLCPWPCWGSLQHSPRPRSCLWMGHPLFTFPQASTPLASLSGHLRCFASWPSPIQIPRYATTTRHAPSVQICWLCHWSNGQWAPV